MFLVGMTNPVNMTIPTINSAAGTSACDKERESAAKVRKTIDIVYVVTRENSQNVNQAPGDRRRLGKK
jgi:hypothetical protein